MARGRALRRYPALAFLVVAAVLAVALPSALTLPNAGPPTLAEFAPVPGSGENAGGDLGRLGSGSSGETGFGSGDGDAPGQPDLPPGQPGGRLKKCVGSPPRQTEDPLSPPCVAFFEGDNGGATWRGVTRDEITVVVYHSSGGSSPPPGTIVDYAAPIEDGDWSWDRALKVYARYFNDRYQTYGRYVHLYGLYGSSNTDPTNPQVIAARRADAQRAAEDIGAFATIPMSSAVVPYIEEAAARKLINVAYDGFARGLYRRLSPRLWGIVPDLEDEARITASYVCRSLAGRPARFSGNVGDTNKRRVFGIAYTDSPAERRGAHLKDKLIQGLNDCGVTVAESVAAAEVFGQAQQQTPEGIARLRAAGVTSVILAATQGTVLSFTTSAGVSVWIPEWIIAGRFTQVGVDQPSWARLMPTEQWRHAFGTTYAPRWGDEYAQHWSRSHREACPDCEIENPYATSNFYDPLALLFHGIQAAGPRLTPANFDKGMHAIPPRRAPDPYTPAAYFTSGNYSYVKDAMEIWWDPSGQAPGNSQPGCYRLPNDGARFRRGEWLRGDGRLFREGVCNGDAPVA